MKISHIETLISRGPFSKSDEWTTTRNDIITAVQTVDWPPGSGKFTIYPESGKKSGEGNGVTPIKLSAIKHLEEKGWKKECKWPVVDAEEKSEGKGPGKIDAAITTSQGLFTFEWETGNVSSSHRSLNKIALGMIEGKLKGGVLVVPSKNLYKFLTDRVGNYDELIPYFPFWRSIQCEDGVMEIFVIEHDNTSFEVPRIPKGTDGRAKK